MSAVKYKRGNHMWSTYQTSLPVSLSSFSNARRVQRKVHVNWWNLFAPVVLNSFEYHTIAFHQETDKAQLFTKYWRANIMTALLQPWLSGWKKSSNNARERTCHEPLPFGKRILLTLSYFSAPFWFVLLQCGPGSLLNAHQNLR